MYVPKHFEESSLDAKHRLIRQQPLGTLITQSPEGLNANHIPFVLSEQPAPFGKLLGHVPRINPVVEELRSGGEILVVFHGPNGYVSPSWYATKKEHGRVVPTWNYSVVHAYGQVELIGDGEWLRHQIESLTRSQEASFAEPWAVDDAPQAFTDRLMQNLVGLEIVITRLLAKTKASQNQPEVNRAGVVAGLKSLAGKNAQDLADAVERGSNYAQSDKRNKTA
jgi:transcriptional regulator